MKQIYALYVKKKQTPLLRQQNHHHTCANALLLNGNVQTQYCGWKNGLGVARMAGWLAGRSPPSIAPAFVCRTLGAVVDARILTVGVRTFAAL